MTGGGSTSPATVSFPGAYKVHLLLTGPPVFSCSGGGAPTSVGSTTSAPASTSLFVLCTPTPSCPLPIIPTLPRLYPSTPRAPDTRVLTPLPSGEAQARVLSSGSPLAGCRERATATCISQPASRDARADIYAWFLFLFFLFWFPPSRAVLAVLLFYSPPYLVRDVRGATRVHHVLPLYPPSFLRPPPPTPSRPAPVPRVSSCPCPPSPPSSPASSSRSCSSSDSARRSSAVWGPHLRPQTCLSIGVTGVWLAKVPRLIVIIAIVRPFPCLLSLKSLNHIFVSYSSQKRSRVADGASRIAGANSFSTSLEDSEGARPPIFGTVVLLERFVFRSNAVETWSRQDKMPVDTAFLFGTLKR
ncbi:hypothetical protein B0H10DRAFT_2441256 [Mycena sp. CBHHK59/15]|nr:hypothetical protein B0H10DRAFT_2441256 [Mycena sp. CBHHK59/15]